jgi:hypothetical protein
VALAGHTGDGELARAGLDDPAAIVRASALGALLIWDGRGEIPPPWSGDGSVS